MTALCEDRRVATARLSWRRHGPAFGTYFRCQRVQGVFYPGNRFRSLTYTILGPYPAAQEGRAVERMMAVVFCVPLHERIAVLPLERDGRAAHRFT
jgi:hypothetical protein